MRKLCLAKSGECTLCCSHASIVHRCSKPSECCEVLLRRKLSLVSILAESSGRVCCRPSCSIRHVCIRPSQWKRTSFSLDLVHEFQMYVSLLLQTLGDQNFRNWKAEPTNKPSPSFAGHRNP